MYTRNTSRPVRICLLSITLFQQAYLSVSVSKSKGRYSGRNQLYFADTWNHPPIISRVGVR